MVLQSPRGIESGYGVNVRNAGLRHPPFSDPGNTSEIANSLPSNVRSINKLEVLEQTFKQEGTTPRQKTREELEDRIDELESENEILQDPRARASLSFRIRELC